MTLFPTKPVTPRERLIVALDFDAAPRALELVDLLGDDVVWYKVGMELFYAAGSGLLGELAARRKRVFLDLKLHDIPNTMAQAVRSLARHEIDLLTVHVPAGPAALRACAEAAGGSGPGLLGVTRLTSLAPPDPANPLADVVALAGLAVECGLLGWIAPVDAARPLRAAWGGSPVLVTPGIRLPGDDAADQVATGTPEAAIEGGADWIVVGRPVTRAEDPRAAARLIVQRMEPARA